MIHRINVFLLSLLIVIAPIYASAGAAEAWTIEEVKYNNVGKNLSYTASRPNAIAANDYVYKANVGVTAARTGSTVANMIRMGLAGAAIYGIVEGVGWIIDNGIVYELDTSEEPSLNKPNVPVVFYTPATNQYFSLEISAIEHLKNYAISENDGYSYVDPTFYFCPNPYIPYSQSLNNCSTGGANVIISSGHWSSYKYYTYQALSNPDYDSNKPAPETKRRVVSDSELGEAVNDSPQASSVLPDVYNPNNPAGGQAPQATDDALNSATPEPRTDPKNDVKNKPNKDTDGDGEPDVYDPELPSEGFEFELPKFCTWAATVCDWYIKYKEDVKKAEKHREDEQVVWTKEEAHRTTEKEVWEEEKTHRTDEKTFWQKVEDWFDWTTEEPELTDESLQIDDQEIISYQHQDHIRFGQTCPFTPQTKTLPMGVLGSLEFETDLTFICTFGTDARPFVLGIGHLGALIFLLIGLRNGNA